LVSEIMGLRESGDGYSFLFGGANSRTLPAFPAAIFTAVHVFLIQPVASLAHSFLFARHGYER